MKTSTKGLAALGSIGLLLVAVGVLAVATRGNPDLHRNVRVVPLGAALVQMNDSGFATPVTEASSGSAVTLILQDVGTRPHAVVVDAPISGVQPINGRLLRGGPLVVEVKPGSSSIVSFTPTAAGRFAVRCDGMDSEGMVADLTVT